MQKKSERLFRIFNRLKIKPQSVEQLHRWCLANNIPAGPRTIYRYLDELQMTTAESGFKLICIEEGSREKCWHVIPEAKESITSYGDAITGFQLLSRLTGLHVKTIGMEYISKLSEEVMRSLDHQDHGSSVFNHLIVTGWGEVLYDENDRTKLRLIMQAIDQKKVVEVETINQIQAETAPNISHWRLHHLIAHRGSVFVAATEKKSDVICFLDIESIIKVRLLVKRFNQQLSKQDVELELVNRFGVTASNGPLYTIRLGFLPSDDYQRSGYLNPFVQKRNWHINQRFYKDPNGLVVLEFKAPLSRELVGWIMMWMDHVKVISPPELIHLIDKKLDDMKRVIGGDPPFFSSPDLF